MMNDQEASEHGLEIARACIVAFALVLPVWIAGGLFMWWALS
jgi:hypothetical protein